MSTLRTLRNTGGNLAVQGIPVFAALAAIPLLIQGAGESRFGILALAWLVTGYFTLFDLGIGRAAIRLITADGELDSNRRSDVLRTSLLLHASLGMLGGGAAGGIGALVGLEGTRDSGIPCCRGRTIVSLVGGFCASPRPSVGVPCGARSRSSLRFGQCGSVPGQHGELPDAIGPFGLVWLSGLHPHDYDGLCYLHILDPYCFGRRRSCGLVCVRSVADVGWKKTA